MKLSKNRSIILLLAFFALLYALISIVNHYNFRTYTLDLGLYTNALYDYIHFQWNDSSTFKIIEENLLADHFDLYLILFSPLSIIFKTYTLLIVQIISILLGGIGIYKYFSIFSINQRIPILATIYFFLFFGIFSSLSFDYHSNVVAASLMPWFFYFFKKKKYITTSIFLLFLLISKENISLWIAFICIGLIIEYRKDRKSLYYLVLFFITSVIYFILITGIVMPVLSNSGSYPHFNYSCLGNNSTEAITFLISHPLEAAKILFTNHTNSPFGDYVKLELHIILLVSGLYFLILKPKYLIMLIPVYFQKLFHDNYSMWGIAGHYSIEYAPILAIGIFSVIGELKSKSVRTIYLILALAGAFAATIRVMDNTVIYIDKTRIRPYKPAHYKRDYSVAIIYEQLNNIPKQAVVSAQSPFLPHLALRDRIYQFPIIKDAEYIVYSLREHKYPLTEDKFKHEIKKINDSGNWETIYNKEDFVILLRITK